MTQSRQQRNSNRVAAIAIAGVAVGMAGLTYASVPLYRMFCEATGYGGTPRVATAADTAARAAASAGAIVVRVRFDGNVHGRLPVTFRPEQREILVVPGKKTVAHFLAKNTGSQPLVGTATFNVNPAKAGPYFAKVGGCCFTSQRLAPGESVDMPVQFYVDPAMLKNRNTREVRTITLSYTFFRADGQDGAPAAGSVDAQPTKHMKAENAGQDRAAAARHG